MWGILAKLVLFNKMQPSEVRRLFGTDGLKSFRTIETNTLNSDSGLNLGRLVELTGFSRGELAASFPSELSTTPSTDIRVANLGTFSRRLRLCSRCISAGIHLALHQCEGIARCPIHCVPLTTECPRCDAPTSLYWVKYLAPFPYRCYECGASMWIRKGKSNWGLALLGERQQLVRELRVWMRDVEEALHVEESKLRFLDRTKSIENIDAATLAAIVPGPQWLNNCLEAPLARVDKVGRWPREALRSGGRHLIGCGKIRGRQFVSAQREALLAKWFYKGLRREIRAIDHGIRNRYLQRHTECEVAINKVEHGCFYPQLKEDLCCWKLGHWIWRQLFDTEFTPEESIASLFKPASFHDGLLWRAWFSSGPGYYLRIETSRPKLLINQSFVERLTPSWIQRSALALYFGCVALAARREKSGLFVGRAVEMEIQSFSTMPSFLLEESRCDLNVFCIDEQRSAAEFLSLAHRHSRNSACSSLSSNEPVYQIWALLGVPESQMNSKLDC